MSIKFIIAKANAIDQSWFTYCQPFNNIDSSYHISEDSVAIPEYNTYIEDIDNIDDIDIDINIIDNIDILDIDDQ